MDKLKVGDRVAVISSGSFTTSHVVSQLVCSKIPDEMNFNEAASIPITYCTAIHGIIDQGRLINGMVRSPALYSLNVVKH